MFETPFEVQEMSGNTRGVSVRSFCNGVAGLVCERTYEEEDWDEEDGDDDAGAEVVDDWTASVAVCIVTG